jgi:hypothetical protein
VLTEFIHVNEYSEPVFKPHIVISGELSEKDKDYINVAYRVPDVPKGIQLIRWMNKEAFDNYIFDN